MDFYIDTKDDSRKLIKWIKSNFKEMKYSDINSYFKKRLIKINDKTAKETDTIYKGDKVSILLDSDTISSFVKKTDSFLSKIDYKLNILYEDSNILIINKEKGVLVQPTKNEHVNTLINYVKAYLYKKGEYDSLDNKSYAPSILNRLDKYTEGIVICAKNKLASTILLKAIRENKVDKSYYAIIKGRISPKEGNLKYYLTQTNDKVIVSNKEIEKSKEAITKYEVIKEKGELTLLDILLITGRTHQIRASFSFKGNPILGDPLYGDKNFNFKYKEKSQLLIAYKIKFNLDKESELSYLNDLDIEIKEIDFIKKYFK